MPSLVSLRHSRFLLLVAALAFASAAQAATILYTEVISGYGGPTDESPSGTLGGIAFGGLGGTPQAAVLELFFQSDTADVTPFSLGGIHGFENVTGTASVEVLDTGGNILVRGAFLASAGIFISVDNTNQGIGFGSQGVLPSDPTFPGQPLYPYSIILNGTSDVGTYDLKGNDIIFSVNAASCVNFPGPCGAPFALATTAGESIRQRKLRRTVRNVYRDFGSGGVDMGDDAARLRGPRLRGVSPGKERAEDAFRRLTINSSTFGDRREAILPFAEGARRADPPKLNWG